MPAVITTGLFHMSKTKPTRTKAADGTFTATLLVLDRQGVHKTEGWRVIYSGPAAAAWWEAEGATLQPGDSLNLALTHVRTHVIGKGWDARAEIHAQAQAVTLVARAGANGRERSTDHATA